jgi:hypothetical protein
MAKEGADVDVFLIKRIFILTITITARFVKPCESGGESPPSLGGWSAQNSK